jgi:hypothetical protein
MTLSITRLSHYTECHVSFTIMLNVIMLSVVAPFHTYHTGPNPKPKLNYYNAYCGADVGKSASLPNSSAAMFQLPTLKHVETCGAMTIDAKCFILCS